jgi:hypothetical protein
LGQKQKFATQHPVLDPTAEQLPLGAQSGHWLVSPNVRYWHKADLHILVQNTSYSEKNVEQCEKYLTWNGHGFKIDNDVRLAELGPFQQLVLMLIKETPRCLQKSIVERTGKDQSQVSKAIDKLVEVGLVVKKEGRLIAQ